MLAKYSRSTLNTHTQQQVAYTHRFAYRHLLHPDMPTPPIDHLVAALTTHVYQLKNTIYEFHFL